MQPILVTLSMALVVSAAGLSAGCTKSEPIVVRKILVDVEPSAERVIERDAVRAMARAFLERDRDFKFDEKNDAASIMRVHIFVATDGEASRALVEADGAPNDADHAAGVPSRPSMVSLGVEVTSGKGKASSSFRGSGVAHAPAGAVPASLVADALREAMTAIMMVRRSDGEDSDVLMALVDDVEANPGARENAIRVLAARKVSAAVPSLLRVMEREEEHLAPVAIFGLGEIGDDAAIDVMIDYATARPPVVRKSVIDAVRAIDTPRGRAWLFTLSTGDVDPDVQLAATMALGVLEGPADVKTAEVDATPEVRVR